MKQRQNLRSRFFAWAFTVCAPAVGWAFSGDSPSFDDASQCSGIMQSIPKSHTYQGKGLTHYFAANKKSQHRAIEGKPWVGNHNNKLNACRDIAADTRVYPTGTKLYIPALKGMKCQEKNGVYVYSDGFFKVMDTGGAIKGKGRFDFFAGGCNNVNTRASVCNDIKGDWARVENTIKKQGVRFCVVQFGTGKGKGRGSGGGRSIASSN